MLLAKIPLLLTSVAGVHTTLTSPQAPAARQERVSYGPLESFLCMKWHIKVAKTLWWTAISAEIMAILLIQFGAKQHLHYLQFAGGNLEALKLTSSFLFGASVTTLSGFGRYLCYHTLGKFFTFEMSIKKDHTLVTSGPYSVVRHPSYAFLAMNYMCLFFAFACPGSWICESGILQTLIGQVLLAGLFVFHQLAVVSLLIRVPQEDLALQQAFGREWEQWANAVPYKLIPHVY